MKKFIIKTNTFKQVINYSLLQKSINKKLHLIIYNKLNLFNIELNYLIYKKELLAIK